MSTAVSLTDRGLSCRNASLGRAVVAVFLRAWAAACLPLAAAATLPGCASPLTLPGVPFVTVLGVAQDGGVPQAGSAGHPAWTDSSRRRLVSCLGLVDPLTGERWMLDATPDFRQQLEQLRRACATGGASAGDGAGPDSVAGTGGRAARGTPSGILLTHAHIGHYTGLMFLGHESMGARGVPVYAMPRMSEFLRASGPWGQLVRYGNIDLRPLEAGAPVQLNDRLRVTPFLVPHRQEYSEVVGFRIQGPRRTALFLPDIDSWAQWDEAGTRIEDVLAGVDVAYIDGTFFANGEIPGRDMTGFPHPLMTATMDRLAPLPPQERAKVRFIHLNHTNPALWEGTPARREIERRGFRVAEEREAFDL